jgi:uncharacterized membrane protein
MWLSLWLIFFPNSIYLLTDIIHLNPKNYLIQSYWFDSIMFFCVFIIGIISSFDSLKSVYTNHFQKLPYRITIFFVWFLACFGIYLGREIRLNSWNVANPLHLFETVISFNHQSKDFVPMVFVWPVCLSIWYFLWDKFFDKVK